MRRALNPGYEELGRYVAVLGLPDHPLLRSLARRYTSKVLTYFIECGGRVKIGKTTDVRRRMTEMQAGMPYPPAVLAAVPEYVVTEARAHEVWAGLRRHGEWFEATPELRRWIRELKKREKVVARLRARIVPVAERRRLCQWREPLPRVVNLYPHPAMPPIAPETGDRMCTSHNTPPNDGAAA
jgi:hypothetical protein